MHIRGIFLCFFVVSLCSALAKKSKIAVLSTYPPTNCGIAEFTKNMITSLKHVGGPFVGIKVFSIAKEPHTRLPSKTPGISVQQFDLVKEKEKSTLLEIAKLINKKKFAYLFVQHEYGLLHDYNNYSVFLREIHPRTKIFIFIHTGWAYPDFHYRKVMQKIAVKSDYLVALGWKVKKSLEHFYGIPKEKILYFPHGVTISKIKRKKKDHEKVILLMSGIMRPSKGVSEALLALKHLKEENKLENIHLLIVGKDYNNQKMKKDFLAQAKKFSLFDRVKWIYGFHSIKKLTEYHKNADIFLTPFIVDVPTSGSVTFAMACGMPVISTPFGLSGELLEQNISIPEFTACSLKKDLKPGAVTYTKHGAIVPFNNVVSLANAIFRLSSDHTLRKSMGRRNKRKMMNLSWKKVSASMLHFLQKKKLLPPLLPDPYVIHTLKTRGKWNKKIVTLNGEHIAKVPNGAYSLYIDSYLSINALIRKNKISQLTVRAMSYAPIQRELQAEETFLYANARGDLLVPSNFELTKKLKKIQYITPNFAKIISVDINEKVRITTPNLIFTIDVENEEILLNFEEVSKFSSAKGLLGISSIKKFSGYHQNDSFPISTWKFNNWKQNMFSISAEETEKEFWMHKNIYGLPGTIKRNINSLSKTAKISFLSSQKDILSNSPDSNKIKEKILQYWCNPKIHLEISSANQLPSQKTHSLENYVILHLIQEGRKKQ
ncbi:hypothetical protein NEFER03_0373 [Nematocida sp. LUAm3]|nr:hypothetical protein NEFER03_0373 [Nematocida sp. LUAm3]KAI5176011.1 hypothetical protein NEFER02_1857 [Nematocida sp. LUAm2]KAI5179108.1 hypothetical protein NEFER01_1975 [Nematocida sp. LUAm1]